MLEKTNELLQKLKNMFLNSAIFVSITSICNSINVLKGKFKLHRESPYDKVGNIVILDSPTVLSDDINPDDFSKQKKMYQEEVDKFISKMKENVSPENLTLMYHNLANLKIKTSNFKLFLISLVFSLKRKNFSLVGGGYHPGSNSVHLYSKPFIALIEQSMGEKAPFSSLQSLIFSHELLHMSSSIVKKHKHCTGFCHHYTVLSNPKRFDFSIGTALNEGYTDLLTERIFGIKNNGGLYEFFKETARIIEGVVGKEKMTNLYFKADLLGLTNVLEKYVPKEKNKRFLLELDNVSNKNIKFIMNYLTELVTNKVDSDLKEGKITKEEATSKYTSLLADIRKLMELYEKNILNKHKGTEEEKTSSMSR